MLTKKIDFKKRAKALQNKSFLKPLGVSVLEEILKRTRSGRDKNGKTFKSYSTSYKKQITSGKHKYKNSTNVNLQSSGEMLRNVDFKVIDNGLRFYMKGSRGKGLSNNDVAYYNKKNGREFLGLPTSREKEIKKDLTKMFKKVLKT